ncbi:hypothetical protein YC2023_083106 [Brassica napus]
MSLSLWDCEPGRTGSPKGKLCKGSSVGSGGYRAVGTAGSYWETVKDGYGLIRNCPRAVIDGFGARKQFWDGYGRERDGRKADRSLRYGRGSVCYATTPDLNVGQIVLMMPERDKGKTDRRDTEFCGKGLIGS